MGTQGPELAENAASSIAQVNPASSMSSLQVPLAALTGGDQHAVVTGTPYTVTGTSCGAAR